MRHAHCLSLSPHLLTSSSADASDLVSSPDASRGTFSPIHAAHIFISFDLMSSTPFLLSLPHDPSSSPSRCNSWTFELPRLLWGSATVATRCWNGPMVMLEPSVVADAVAGKEVVGDDATTVMFFAATMVDECWNQHGVLRSRPRGCWNLLMTLLEPAVADATVLTVLQP